jgi:hypothetical protein
MSCGACYRGRRRVPIGLNPKRTPAGEIWSVFSGKAGE